MYNLNSACKKYKGKMFSWEMTSNQHMDMMFLKSIFTYFARFLGVGPRTNKVKGRC
jgi:hypothetical protein